MIIMVIVMAEDMEGTILLILYVDCTCMKGTCFCSKDLINCQNATMSTSILVNSE